MRMIAIGISYVVLHVTDDGIVPITKVQGSVRRKDRI